MTDELQRRQVEALERIAGALEKLTGVTSRTEVTPGEWPAGEWFAAPMVGTRRDIGAFYRAFHAVRRPEVGLLVTACGASGCGGTVDQAAARPLEQVPTITREATRCAASGCREVFAQHPVSTESSGSA